MPGPLPTRHLGKNGPTVTGLGLGLMGLSAFYGPAKPDSERMAFLDAAYAAGERFWDSADMYGDSEDLVGKWLRNNPDKASHIFLATKFANKYDPSTQTRSVDSSPEYCLKACQKSLDRLGVKQIDLYYVHRVDKTTPIEKTMEAMLQLKREGKIRHIGLSEVSAKTLERALKVAHVDAVQVEYSPFALEIESDQIGVMKVCRENGIAIVAYSPLCRGMLTGALKGPEDFAEGDFRSFSPRFSKENMPKNLAVVDKLSAIAKSKNATPGQVTLAWLLAQDDLVIPIPGTTRIDRLKENLGALEITLNEDEKRQIREIAEQAEISGGRYPDAFAAHLYADTPEL